MEAEYAAASAAQELVNVKGIMSEFVQSDQKSVLKVDRASAISMVKTYQNSKEGNRLKSKIILFKICILSLKLIFSLYQLSLM